MKGLSRKVGPVGEAVGPGVTSSVISANEVFEVAAYRMANPHGKITVKPLFVTCRLKG